LNTFTSSASTRLTSIEEKTGSISSLNTYTGSNNALVGTLQTATGALNTFTSSINGAIEVTGSNLTIKGNLLVKGTTTQVDSTTVSIGDNIIQLNGTGATNAGLVVRDPTAPSLISGSLLWDTNNDKWIAGVLGSEDDVVLRTTTQTLTNKTINASQLVDGSVTNTKLQNSAITIAGTSTSLGGSITAATILSGTGTVSGSNQIVFGSISSIPSGLVSGSSQVLAGTTIHSGSFFNGITVVSGSGQIAFSGITGVPSGLVSGSSQVSYGSLSGIPSGIVSGSSQVLSGTTIHSGSFFNGISVVSGSAQIAFGSITGVPSGLVSGSSQVTYGSLSGIPSGIVSGSSQITLSGTTGFGSYLNQAVLTSSSPTFNYVYGTSIQINGNGSSNDPYGTVSVTQPSTLNYSYYGLTRAGQIGMGMGINTSSQFFIGSTTSGATGAVLNGTAWVVLSSSVATFNGTLTASNFSGTHSGTSSGTNTGDQTNISGNAATATISTSTSNIGGATWAPSTNIILPQSANNQEWSFDITRNGFTGGYWHVWDSSNSTMLKVDAVSGKVSAPYNFVGTLEGGITGNAATVTNGVYTTGDQTIGGIKTFNGTHLAIENSSGTWKYIRYRTGATDLWDVGTN
jgi:hypothetical protein